MLETEGQLAIFRAEIETLRNRYGSKDATLANVKDVEELDEKDMESWQIYKKILTNVNNLVNDPEAMLSDCKDLMARNFVSKTESVAESGRQSKLSFMSWLNNRNPFSWAQLFTSGDISAEELKLTLTRDIGRYL